VVVLFNLAEGEIKNLFLQCPCGLRVAPWVNTKEVSLVIGLEMVHIYRVHEEHTDFLPGVSGNSCLFFMFAVLGNVPSP
jgi:hypothetical protein